VPSPGRAAALGDHHEDKDESRDSDRDVQQENSAEPEAVQEETRCDRAGHDA
jgi:hypothetical protein